MDPEENGQGEIQDAGQEQTNGVQPEVNQEPQEKLPPTWAPILDSFSDLPESFRNQVAEKVKPTLKQWDDNFQKVQSQYAPYKPLVERNVPFEQIEKAMQLAHYLNTNPQAIYQELHSRFGQQQSEQGQQEEEENYEEEEDENPQYDLEKDPRWIAQQEQIAQMQEILQQQFDQKQEIEMQEAISSEWQALESKAGTKFPDDVKAEIINRAIWLADQQGPDAEPSLEAGYNSYVQFVSKVRNERPNNTAPDVLSGNGGVPHTPVNFAKMQGNERVDYIANKLKALNENQ